MKYYALFFIPYFTCSLIFSNSAKGNDINKYSLIENDKNILDKRQLGFKPASQRKFITVNNFDAFVKQVNLSIIELFNALKTSNTQKFLNEYKYVYYSGGDTALIEDIIHERKLKEKSNSFQSARFLPNENDFEIFSEYGIKKGINWNEIKREEIQISINENKFLIEFKCNNFTYTLALTFKYDENEDNGIIYFPYELFTYKSMNFNQYMESTEREFSYEESLKKKEDYLVFNFPGLRKEDLKFVKKEFMPCYIYSAIASNEYNNKNYLKAMIRLTKIIKLYPSIDCSSCSLLNLQRAYFLRGVCKLNLKDNKGALNDFNLCYLLKPEEVPTDFYYFRAVTKKENKDFAGAIQDFNKALKINSNDKDAFLERGTIKYFNLKNKQSACLDWSKAGELGNEKAYEFIKEYCK